MISYKVVLLSGRLGQCMYGHTVHSWQQMGVKDARLTQMYSFLPAFWAGDTHRETNFLPIGDREEKGEWLLNCHTDSLGTRQVLVAKYLWQTRIGRDESRLLAINEN